MARLVLDTDAVIDLLNGRTSTRDIVERHLDDGDTLCICDIVVAEVLSGTRLTDRQSVHDLLDTFEFLPSTPEVGRIAGHWRFDLARQGIALGTPDAIIAATAVAWHAALLTGNVRDFPTPEVTVVPLLRAST